MDMLQGETLINKSGAKVAGASVAGGNRVICYYFSAHWCPPCRMFTPILADFYSELKESGASIEIIFVSSDRSVEEMRSYMNEAHGDWLAAPWGSELASKLKAKYGISGIPALIVVRSDGSIITRDGRSDVHRMGTMCYNNWK